jgi:hypothetical protein
MGGFFGGNSNSIKTSTVDVNTNVLIGNSFSFGRLSLNAFQTYRIELLLAFTCDGTAFADAIVAAPQIFLPNFPTDGFNIVTGNYADFTTGSIVPFTGNTFSSPGSYVNINANVAGGGVGTVLTSLYSFYAGSASNTAATVQIDAQSFGSGNATLFTIFAGSYITIMPI